MASYTVRAVRPPGDDARLRRRPLRIILVRHGESKGNVDETMYTHTADSNIPLTDLGRCQAEECGRKIRAMIEGGPGGEEPRVYFYVSPYKRTLQTLAGIGRAFQRHEILGVREEPRIREQDFGNFQVREKMQVVKDLRVRFGKFFYRFPEGESAADVYDRVTGFVESMWRDINLNRLHANTQPGGGKGGHRPPINVVIVTHGLTMRVFLMRWFKWTTAQFESLWNPCNCETRVMHLGPTEQYSLTEQHSAMELERWGLSPCMIKDQEAFRSNKRRAPRAWTYSAFFDHLGPPPADARVETPAAEENRLATAALELELQHARLRQRRQDALEAANGGGGFPHSPCFADAFACGLSTNAHGQLPRTDLGSHPTSSRPEDPLGAAAATSARALASEQQERTAELVEPPI
eukprot:SM000029S10436  [mRNA]  locus=s29:124713:126864:+ [translate_table: standard]